MFMSVGSVGAFWIAAALTVVHMVCAFLILTMLLGSAFSSNFGAHDKVQFARQSFIAAMIVTSVPTALLLGLVWIFSASTLGATLLVFAFSVVAGTAIDITAVMSPFDNTSTENPVEAPTTTAEESSAKTTEPVTEAQLLASEARPATEIRAGRC